MGCLSMCIPQPKTRPSAWAPETLGTVLPICQSHPSPLGPLLCSFTELCSLALGKRLLAASLLVFPKLPLQPPLPKSLPGLFDPLVKRRFLVHKVQISSLWVGEEAQQCALGSESSHLPESLPAKTSASSELVSASLWCEAACSSRTEAGAQSSCSHVARGNTSETSLPLPSLLILFRERLRPNP